MNDYSYRAIEKATHASVAYCKFITPNEVGLTGGHQSGFLIGKASYKVIFDTPGERGSNKDSLNNEITWQDSFKTKSRFIYYGVGSRNEYRITQFGRGFPFLSEDNIGNLLVLCKMNKGIYNAYVLSTDDEIDTFLAYFNLLPTEANRIITTNLPSPRKLEQDFINTIEGEFPTTISVSKAAQGIYSASHNSQNIITSDPDKAILDLIETEYSLFQQIEKKKYKDYLKSPFESIESLTSVANEILNRRKSRAGKSLENHLALIFDVHNLEYSAQKYTEARKTPDFVMPDIAKYHDTQFDSKNLTMLGAKTTCKDRWRQVLNEANRIPNKHLFTLQPGISSNQLDEMKAENLTLVVPAANISSFPEHHRKDLLTLREFIKITKDKQ